MLDVIAFPITDQNDLVLGNSQNPTRADASWSRWAVTSNTQKWGFPYRESKVLNTAPVRMNLCVKPTVRFLRPSTGEARPGGEIRGALLDNSSRVLVARFNNSPTSNSVLGASILPGRPVLVWISQDIEENATFQKQI